MRVFTFTRGAILGAGVFFSEKGNFGVFNFLDRGYFDGICFSRGFKFPRGHSTNNILPYIRQHKIVTSSRYIMVIFEVPRTS